MGYKEVYMNKSIKDELLSLEEYDKKRDDIKLQIIKHKEHRSVKIGENILLLFEDFKTIKYQIQEMLRIEKIFNDKEIDEEISASQSKTVKVPQVPLAQLPLLLHPLGRPLILLLQLLQPITF